LTLSFHSLIDALVVARFRDFGVSMQYLRKVYEKLVEEFSTANPFSRRDLYTDGKTVFLSYADALGQQQLKEILTSQHNFPQILTRYLKQIEYDQETLLALRWHVAEGVVIDPRRKYGKPIVEGCGVPTAILAAAYEANHRDRDIVAEWYGVSQFDVDQAVAFESSLRLLVA
jgi:uncharacterized protein (DUF433 family)